MHFEIWDTASGNLLYDFDTEAEAIDAVRRLVDLNGSETTDALAVVRVTDGRTVTLAEGAGLLARATASGHQQAPRSA